LEGLCLWRGPAAQRKTAPKRGPRPALIVPRLAALPHPARPPLQAANKIAPSSANIGLPGLYTLIHERYRNPPSEQGKTVYETDAWFHVEDLVSNFLKKRIVIAVNTMGMQSWTLTVNLKDTPDGLKARAGRGFDWAVGPAARGGEGRPFCDAPAAARARARARLCLGRLPPRRNAPNEAHQVKQEFVGGPTPGAETSTLGPNRTPAAKKPAPPRSTLRS
jgi:hypothetical protein